jgi:hypothetical protein
MEAIFDQPPSLFGLTHSNRDFRTEEGWSKNNFNSAFPASLACYMSAKNIHPVYLILDESGQLTHSQINVSDLFGIDPLSDDLFFSFESDFTPYQQLVVGNLPRIDLVLLQRSTGYSLRGIEIKLTALPDNSTFHLGDEGYGCEIVVRPDTIVYLALSICLTFKDHLDQLRQLLQSVPLKLVDWADGDELLPYIPDMVMILNQLMRHHAHLQQPLVMQPIWKTEGKKPILHQNAFDIFVWSNFAFTRLFFYVTDEPLKRISRQARSIVWLMKMLIDYAQDGRINHTRIIDELSHATKNDKAFSVPGRITHPLMTSSALSSPRIHREEIRNIILGGGQNLLSPERRLDYVLLRTPGLFD